LTIFKVFLASIPSLAGFFAHQEETRLLWPPVFLGFGSALYFSLYSEPSPTLTVSAWVAIIPLIFWTRRLYRIKSESEIRYLIFLLVLAIIGIALGFSLSQIRSHIAGTPMIEKETRLVKIEATLAHMEDQGGKKGKQILLEDLAIEKWTPDQTPKSVRLTARTKMDEGIEVGDRISLLAKLSPPAQPVMPGTYDYARHFYFEGIGGLGFAVSRIYLVEHRESIIPKLDKVRQNVSKVIKENTSGPSQGIVVALMTGERAAIDDQDWQALRASGLAHIISISGLHVAMVAAPVFFIVRFFLSMISALALRFDIKKISAFVALIVCSAYVGFVVPSVPTTRALLMTGVALIAIMLDRSPFSLRLIGFSAILVLVISPESIWSASFQMSFAAVTALVAVAEWMRPIWLKQNRDAGWIKKIMLYLSGAILTSFVASLATAPFVWYHFQQMASYSVLGNMLAMPLSGIIIMPMMLISYVLIPFGIAGYSLQMMTIGVDWLLEVARFVQDLPGALITGEMSPPAFLYLCSLSGLIFILFKGKWKFISLPFLAFALIFLMIEKTPDILISQTGKIIMVKDGQTSWVSTIRKERFIRNQWLQHLGIATQNPFPKEGQVILTTQDKITCDQSLCRIIAAGTKISFGESYDALQKDCDWADILVTSKWLGKKFCPHAKVMDAGFFRKYGAAQITRENSRSLPRIETARDYRGWRPWSYNPRNY